MYRNSLIWVYTCGCGSTIHFFSNKSIVVVKNLYPCNMYYIRLKVSAGVVKILKTSNHTIYQHAPFI